MKTTIRIALCLLVLAGLVAVNGAGEKAASEITILVPEKGQDETKVKIGSLEEFPGGKKEKKGKMYWRTIDGEGGTRTLKITLPKDKNQKFTLEADIEPNNYTHIYRTKEFMLKGGENVKLDMTVKNPKTDKIVVRWVPTPDDIVDEMCKLAKVTKNDVVYDLGCGDAVMLIRPLQKFKVKKGVGIDIDPKMIEIAKKKAKEAKVEDRIDLRVGDILNVKDMKEASVVLLYIGDDLGERLSPVLQKTCKPGTRIVSHRFSLGEWEPTKKLTVKGEDGGEYDLLLWVVPEKKLEKKKASK